MKHLIILAALVSLAGCASTLNTPHAIAERAEIVAERAFVDAVPLMTVDQQKIAWADLQKIRQAYNASQDITVLVNVLMADLPKKVN